MTQKCLVCIKDPETIAAAAPGKCRSIFLFVFVFAIGSCLFLAALRSHVKNGMTTWLYYMGFVCFVTFPDGAKGQVW